MTKKKPFADLRAFIDFLRQEDRLKSISGADWNLELGGLTELVWRKKGEDCPALLFDNIKGYPSGYRVMTLGVASTYHYNGGYEFAADRRSPHGGASAQGTGCTRSGDSARSVHGPDIGK